MKDKEIEKLIQSEAKRQDDVINLIASENYVSDDVLHALGSIFTNKYAEGYSAMRYYGGNEVVDELENITKQRALDAFGLDAKEWHVNVQPLSGSPANIAVYAALVPIGEKIMSMELSHGGHLSHGHKVTFVNKAWQQVAFQVDKETEQINHDELEALAKKEKPKIVIAGFTAYPRIVDFAAFRKIADAAGAYLLADMSHFSGLVAGGVYPSPFPHADVVMTTTHKTLRGPRAALLFIRKDEREIHKIVDKSVFPGFQGGPHANQIAATAVALKEATTDDFKTYAAQVVANAKAMAEEFTKLGWRLVSGGTDSHLLLVDVWNGGKGISGKKASNLLEEQKIIVNKNTIPFDTRSPMSPSGIRIGTPAETTRGKKEKDMVEIAQQIDAILKK